MTEAFNLFEARLNKGLSQRELAVACKVSLTVIQRLEAGGNASPRTAKRVADFFEIKVSGLMNTERTP